MCDAIVLCAPWPSSNIHYRIYCIIYCKISVNTFLFYEFCTRTQYGSPPFQCRGIILLFLLLFFEGLPQRNIYSVVYLYICGSSRSFSARRNCNYIPFQGKINFLFVTLQQVSNFCLSADCGTRTQLNTQNIRSISCKAHHHPTTTKKTLRCQNTSTREDVNGKNGITLILVGRPANVRNFDKLQRWPQHDQHAEDEEEYKRKRQTYIEFLWKWNDIFQFSVCRFVITGTQRAST